MDKLQDTSAVILAAGKGTRMKSDRSKVMSRFLDRPMLWYPLHALTAARPGQILIVVGHGRESVRESFPEYQDRFVVQDKQLGTGHALQQAWPRIQADDSTWVLVTNGDTPLAEPEHFISLAREVRSRDADMGLLGILPDDPSGYGRIIRDSQGEVSRIVEEADLDQNIGKDSCREINSGIYFFRKKSLEQILFELDSSNQQKEFYITQLISLARKKKMKVACVSAGRCPELLGVNNPGELADQEEYLRGRIVRKHVLAGAVIRNQSQVRIGPLVEIDPGADLTGPCEIYGASFVSGTTRIDSHCYIEDSVLMGCRLYSFSHLCGARLEKDAQAGPFARLRPGTVLGPESKAGNFVEIKKSEIGKKSKISHLSYLGDTRVGERVNIGAGTITCNYDGRKKHETTIEDRVFIGSNTALVAPVRISRDSLVAAGSIITLDVPEESLAVARSRQKNLQGKNPLKKS
ncbi:MAG: bifunctional UDP-N-acetylglucosamine diphosphorylase/glucosamine-1-phosphate N-acetyltransferase GlmU [Desulfonatronovibrionaceae bacterium]